MKIKTLQQMGWGLIFLSVLLISCQDDQNPKNKEPDLAVVQDELVINSSYEDMDNITLDVMKSSGLGLRTTGTNTLCAGATINHDLNGKKITVNFGTGCTGPQGNVRKGKLILTYSSTNFLIPGTSIVTSFDNYEVNGIKITGTRTLTNTGVDIANSTVTVAVKIENGKLTWPDNTFVTYNSNQVRLLKFTNGGGYEAKITGTASGKSRANFDYTATIKEQLVVKKDCVESGVYIPISGILEFNYRGITVSVNYGDGTCDKKIQVTYTGGSKDIILD
jgi:hypothetical protein